MSRLYSEDRLQIQPAFVYAVLAMASLMKSSKLEAGSVGLSQAMDLINEAHIAYKDAIELHWLDVTLVEAAFVCSYLPSSTEVLITPHVDFGTFRNIRSPPALLWTNPNFPYQSWYTYSKFVTHNYRFSWSHVLPFSSWTCARHLNRHTCGKLF